MALGWQGGQVGNPINSKMQLARQNVDATDAEANRTLEAITGFVDGYFAGFSPGIEPNTIRALALSGDGEPTSPITGKHILNPDPLNLGSLDPSSPFDRMLLAQMFDSRYLITGYETNSWYRQRFDLSQSIHATAWPYLTGHYDGDINFRTVLKAFQAQGFRMSTAPNDNVLHEWVVGFEDYHFFGPPSQTAGSGSDIPRIRGLKWAGQWADDASLENIKVRMDTDNGASWVCSGAIGAAAYGVTFTASEGEWSPIRDEAGDIIGDPEDPVAIYLEVDNNAVITDEFTFAARRSAWSQSLPPQHVVSSVSARLYRDGVLWAVDGDWSLSCLWEIFNRKPAVHGLSESRIERAGELQTEVTTTSQATNLDIQRALHQGSTLSLEFDLVSKDQIGATSPVRFHRRAIVLPALRVSGRLKGTDNQGRDRDENPTFTAGQSASNHTFVDEWNLQNETVNAGISIAVLTDGDVSAI